MSKLPMQLIGNAAAPIQNGVLDLEGEIAKEVTFFVLVKGSVTSFSIDLKAAHLSPSAAGNGPVYTVLQTVTEPGAYTLSSHWARYFTAELTAISGASFPNNVVSVTVAAAPPKS